MQPSFTVFLAIEDANNVCNVTCFVAMQVYMMTWIERKMAAALYAVPPSATVDEALSHFMEVLSSSQSYSVIVLPL